jgi:stage II sporulation protein D
MRRIRRRRRFPARFLIVVLLLGIAAMYLISLGQNTTHQLDLMEPVEPFDEVLSTPKLDLSEIHDEQTLSVAVNGKVVKMALEDYVFGVIAAEMPASFAPEALKAQAVAARTFAVHRIMYGGCSKYPGADVCDLSSHCQAYQTVDELKSKWKGNYATYAAKLKQAVSQTAGQIMTYDDQPILVLYHASSAGYTESVENVYAQKLPYLRSVPSPDDGKVTNIEDREEYDRKWFCNTVNKAYPKAKLSANSLEKQVSIVSRFPSGRVDTVKLGGVQISAIDLRRLVDLRSTNFKFSFNKYSIVITTEGFGHGVGMSQDGAQGMALEGSDYVDILTHYYTGVKIADMH